MAKMDITQNVIDPKEPTPAALYYCKICLTVSAMPTRDHRVPYSCAAMRETLPGKFSKCGGNLHRITLA
jgi:hypothetical protein